MIARDDRARDERPGIDVTGDVDPADIRHDEQPTPTAREIPAGEQGCQETDTATEGMSPNRDMADTREIPADELAEAGHLSVETARDMLLHPGGYGRSLLALASEVVVTALDVRGRERDAARAEVERLRGRDEAVESVVQALGEMRANEALMRAVLLPPWLLEALDALARAHEARDGGRDR